VSVTSNDVKKYLADLDTYGHGPDEWILAREHFEALCKLALEALSYQEAGQRIGTYY
jgi:hypothetical protein